MKLRANDPPPPPPPIGNKPLPMGVLLVENSKVFAGMIKEAVKDRLGLPVTTVTTLADARQALDPAQHFLVLTGLVLPDGTPDLIIDSFSASGLPTVVVTGVFDPELRQRLMNKSVVDYVLKNAPGNLDYLVWVIKRIERNRRLSAIVVDDSPSARRMTAAVLGLFGLRVVEAGNGQQALDLISADSSIRLAVVDYHMPGMNGVEFSGKVRAVRTRDKLAVIGVSASEDGDLVAQFLKNGANDFLHKPYSREEFFCRVSQNIDSLELIGTLQDLATKDFLTGLPNRRHFHETGEALFQHTARADMSLVAAIFDIDFFKKINDTFGHDGGDLALKAVARTLTEHARPQDVVARVGGEEFCILAPRLDEAGARDYFEELRQRMEAMSIDLGDRCLKLTISIGVRLSRDGNLHNMLAEADRALYLAKAGGRNRVVLAEDHPNP